MRLMSHSELSINNLAITHIHEWINVLNVSKMCVHFTHLFLYMKKLIVFLFENGYITETIFLYHAYVLSFKLSGIVYFDFSENAS